MNPIPDIPILFEDAVLLAVNKPAGLAVHHTPDPSEPNLQCLLEARFSRHLLLFHRLDRDTTGVVLLGKDRAIAPTMLARFATHRIRKCYWAVVSGRWDKRWNRVETGIQKGARGGWETSDSPQAPQHALTTFHVLAQNDEKSWIEALPKTGRPHQIRLHCHFQGCPILGDTRYGTALDQPMALHAYRLDLRHPVTQTPLSIIARPPTYWHTHLDGLTIKPALQTYFNASDG